MKIAAGWQAISMECQEIAVAWKGKGAVRMQLGAVRHLIAIGKGQEVASKGVLSAGQTPKAA
jgi:hypothetical protein